MLPVSPVSRFFASLTLFRVVLALVVLCGVAVCYASSGQGGGDHHSYLSYVEGIKHGRYSCWWFYPDYVPDTLRNPGYPAFLYLLSFISPSVSLIQVVQVFLYVGAVGLLLYAIRRQYADGQGSYLLIANLFLLLLLPNLNIAHYASQVIPEVLNTFLIAAYFTLVVFWAPGSWRRAVVLALIGGAAFQTRPVFLFLPVIQLGLEWLLRRPQFRIGPALVQLLLFGLTMIPYGLWNQRNHGQFRITSLEGGAGIMQLGFWSFRMPGYFEHRNFGNIMGNEAVRFVDDAEVPAYIAAYEREWDGIDRELRPYYTRLDSLYLDSMRTHQPFMIMTRSSRLTAKREELMVQRTLQHIREEPGYYFKTRIFTFFRLYITGVQLDDWAKAKGPVGHLKVLYPFLVSATTFLLALILIPLALWRRRVGGFAFWFALLITAYFGAIHVPFAIQARYTTPVRLLLIYATAVSAGSLIQRRRPVVVAAPPVPA